MLIDTERRTILTGRAALRAANAHLAGQLLLSVENACVPSSERQTPLSQRRRIVLGQGCYVCNNDGSRCARC
jgi:hypothetical protein